MDIDIKILPTVGYSLTERGEQLKISLNLQTYKHKVNILGSTVFLISDDIEVEKNISYIKRYLDPKSNLDLNLHITCCNTDSPVEKIIYEFQNKMHSLTSKGIDRKHIGFKIKSRIYEIKNEYVAKVLELLELPGKDIQLKLKVDYDPIKGFMDRFNKESILIEKSFLLPDKERLKLMVDNFLMQEVSKILLAPEKVEFPSNMFSVHLV
jgi:hypothetical protein